MKVPINWLKDYVEIDDDQELMRRLTSVGHMQDGPSKEIGSDKVYDLEVRQNRSDCLSMLGIARESAAVSGKTIKDPYLNLKPLPDLKAGTTIKIEDPKLCYRFNTITFKNVKIGESPEWLKQKLTAYGMKSINNLVDITNFVMLELGQPLHAFDVEKVKSQTLIVRSAKEGETVKLLDEQVIKLTNEDFVIADPEKPVAMGGIMGGVETSITNQTTSFILEAANYNQAVVRRSSIRRSIRTEGSTRHEKFLNPHLTELALQRARDMILELCGGEVVDHTDEYPTKYEEPNVKLNIQMLNSLGGIEFNQGQIDEILSRLGIKLPEIPYWRTDLKIEEDIIEEVLRIYGYENIQAKLPSTPAPASIDSKAFLIEEQIRDTLVAAGYDEQVTEPLTDGSDSNLEPVKLENSLNTDKTMLRTSLRNSLNTALQNQKKYRKKNIKLFELGKIYYKDESDYKEEKYLGLITSGVDYFELKGTLELLKENFENSLSDEDLNIHILDQNTYFVELPLPKIEEAKILKPFYEPPQIILQDISLLTPTDTKVGELISAVKAGSKLLTTVKLGEKPQKKGDKKTVFLKLEFTGKNLTNEQVAQEKVKLIQLLKDEYKAEIR